MTDAKLKELMAQVSTAQARTEASIDRVTKQIGAIGNKFGSFTEGMALPSMQKLLIEKFDAEFIAPRAQRRRGGETMELDVLAYSNGRTNRVIAVEVKSHLREDHLEEFIETLEKFPEFFPEHRGKEVIGILAAVDIPADMPKRVAKAGIHLARIHDETFQLVDPRGFRAKSFAA